MESYLNNKLFCISVCTRKRPEMLLNMLNSVEKINLPKGINLAILIVENNETNQVESLVKSFSKQSFHAVYYFHEPRLGIPIARNRCLQEAINIDATHLIFIDDKELVDPNILVEYWDFSKSLEYGSFISGQIKSLITDQVPGYYKNFLQRDEKKTGTLLDTCPTGNVFLPFSLVKEWDLLFDESSPLSGGTDTQFFNTATEKGIKLIYCNEAVAYEIVPVSRCSWRWLLKRSFRSGVTLGRIGRGSSKNRHLKYYTKRLAGILINTFRCIVFFFSFRKEKSLKYGLKVSRKTGECMGAMGMTIDSYKSVDGQ